MNDASRTFTLVGIIVFLLLMMNQLPTLHLGDIELRHVNVLADVIIPIGGEDEDIDVIPKPDLPKQSLTAHARKDKPPFEEVVPEGVTMIEDYSGGEPGGMAHFYEALCSVDSLDRPVRIAYFGDSFIEGDILTSDLRENLQERFGGEGPGWIDCGSALNKGFRRTIMQHYSGVEEFAVITKPFDRAVQGFNQRYYTVREGANVRTTATTAMARASHWKHARLFLRTRGGLTVSQTPSGGMIQRVSVSGSPQIQHVDMQADSMSSLNYQFTGVGSGTYIYGMALEGDGGVVLDNYSMRGSPGFTIADVPQQTLNDFARLHPYDLIILHFGLNVASPKAGRGIYETYTNRMKTVIEHLLQACPEASVLVVGVPDRDQRTANGISTMKGVEELLAYQRRMAGEAQVAFYDIFKAMGGRGSMRKLVDQKMANKDYTHINIKGGQLVAGHFFRSLMAGYDNYVRRKAYDNE